MPSKSKAQQNMMRAAAHDPKFAAKVGMPEKVAKKYVKADKKLGVKFKHGGKVKSK